MRAKSSGQPPAAAAVAPNGRQAAGERGSGHETAQTTAPATSEAQSARQGAARRRLQEAAGDRAGRQLQTAAEAPEIAGNRRKGPLSRPPRFLFWSGGRTG